MLKIQNLSNWKQAETEHIVLLNKLKSNFRNGDWTEVAKRTGLHKENCTSAFRRMHSKNHALVVKTLHDVIDERMEQLKQA